MSTRWARVIRGLIAATFAVFVADLAHVVGGASASGLAGLALAFAFAALVCIALAGRKPARWRIAASVILSQGAFHVLFLLFGATTGAAPQPVGMQMGATLAVGDAHAGGARLAESGYMLAAHGVAAAITIVALFWGESSFWAVLASARLSLGRVLRLPTIVAVLPRQHPAPVRSFHGASHARLLVIGLRRRGPPVTTLAFS